MDAHHLHGLACTKDEQGKPAAPDHSQPIDMASPPRDFSYDGACPILQEVVDGQRTRWEATDEGRIARSLKDAKTEFRKAHSDQIVALGKTRDEAATVAAGSSQVTRCLEAAAETSALTGTKRQEFIDGERKKLRDSCP